jgi:hypothetical protein
MFEAQIAYYLNEYLGKYVEGIDRKSLTCVFEFCIVRVLWGRLSLEKSELNRVLFDDAGYRFTLET